MPEPLLDGPIRNDSNRADISLVCDVRQGLRPWSRVRLENLSPTGFRIAWSPTVKQNEPIKIRIPGLQVLTAAVRWKNENSFGCSFDAPLHDAVFAHIVTQADRF